MQVTKNIHKMIITAFMSNFLRYLKNFNCLLSSSFQIYYIFWGNTLIHAHFLSDVCKQIYTLNIQNFVGQKEAKDKDTRLYFITTSK